MTWLTAYGLCAVTAMLVCYAAEERSHWFTLAFAGTCLAAAAYAFLQGAWPFGVVEVVWSACAVRRWWRRSRGVSCPAGRRKNASLPTPAAEPDSNGNASTTAQTGRPLRD